MQSSSLYMLNKFPICFCKGFRKFLSVFVRIPYSSKMEFDLNPKDFRKIFGCKFPRNMSSCKKSFSLLGMWILHGRRSTHTILLQQCTKGILSEQHIVKIPLATCRQIVGQRRSWWHFGGILTVISQRQLFSCQAVAQFQTLHLMSMTMYIYEKDLTMLSGISYHGRHRIVVIVPGFDA